MYILIAELCYSVNELQRHPCLKAMSLQSNQDGLKSSETVRQNKSFLP